MVGAVAGYHDSPAERPNKLPSIEGKRSLMRMRRPSMMGGDAGKPLRNPFLHLQQKVDPSMSRRPPSLIISADEKA